MKSTMAYMDNIIEWHSNGFRYREHGPAAIDVVGCVGFSHTPDARRHYNRTRGPAIIDPSGIICYKNTYGLTHRTDGPALIYADGTKQYWVRGRRIPVEQFFATYGVV